MGFSDQIPLHLLTGLRPRAWISAGPGFVREDLKEQVLAHSKGFIGDAVTTPQEICLKVLGAAGTHLETGAILGSFGRQEILRRLFRQAAITARLPELSQLRRQSTFFHKLDRALQSGRMCFSHFQEEQVMDEQLKLRVGANPVRDELRLLAGAYEAFLQAADLWDPALLYRRANEILASGLPEGLSLPEEVVHFHAQTQESLEAEFWSHLKSYTQVRFFTPLEGREESPIVSALWERWHTLDDAAESFAERLSRERDLSQHAVLIPDQPAIRRSLRRALEAHGVPLADPRDPTRLRWEEDIKWALLPLRVVAGNFDRRDVIAWIRAEFNGEKHSETNRRWVREILERGIRNDLENYVGGHLTELVREMGKLVRSFATRRTCEELGRSHLEYLSLRAGLDPDREWLIEFFEATWEELVRDMSRIEYAEKKAPPLYWLDRLEARVHEASPPVNRFKPEGGLKLYRLQQAPLDVPQNLWIFGLPPGWFSADGAGDYWYNAREREVLSGEFAVRSGIQIRDERLKVLKTWLQNAAEITLLDAQYNWDGRERETLLPVLRELGCVAEPEIKGCHPRWLGSFSALRPAPPQDVQLPPLSHFGVDRLRATEIDRYSKCGFQALAGSRWNVRDVRDPQAELWADVRGNLFHHAVLSLIRSRDPDGNFTVSCGQALDEAWLVEKPKGLLKGARVERYAKSKMLSVLEAFCEKEREYFNKVHAEATVLEDSIFELQYDGFKIQGKPDRIDLTQDGLFVIDYKTSSALPKGQETIEMGYGLQLPFYVLAARAQLGKEVIGAQFVELNRKAGRSSGIFLKQYNGKESGKPTNARSNSKSLVDLTPQDAWARCEEQLHSHAQAYFQGTFRAQPKKSSECQSCMYSDFCGHRRRVEDSVTEAESAE